MKVSEKPRNVVITGVSQGIGFSVVETFLKNGDRVVGCACEPENAQVAQLREKYPNQFSYKEVNVTHLDEIKAFAKYVEDKFGHLDILISNAGRNVFKGVECSEEDWDYNFDLNLKSHWRIAKAFKPLLEKQKGVIIIMTSNHAYYTLPGCTPYNISKGALLSLVQSLMLEWGPDIRTVGIAPGFIDTEGNQAFFDSHEDPVKIRTETEDKHCVKRIGAPEEVGNLCLFLSSDLASFIAGTTILIDGGRSAVMQD